MFIVAQCFAIGRLMFLAEMAPARFITSERVGAHQFGKFQEIGDAPRPLQGLIELFAVARDSDVAPKFFSQRGNSGERFAQSGGDGPRW